ncbi:hypothetical protein TNCV_4070261 [Trichonephila clavipes]|nr:hypothetical protein TNCV_4070261 [Trichonephila clavipes]
MGGTLNSRQAASPLVRLVEGEEGWEASDYPQSVLPLNWGGIEPNRTVTSPVEAPCYDPSRTPIPQSALMLFIFTTPDGF